MALHFSANQYQGAFESNHLQSWNIAKRYKERPAAHDGHTEFITNDRGHLLPGIPRSERNPWGMFVGTWDMPLKIPPFKASLTGRSVQASKHLAEWMLKPTSLTYASNGIQPHITGKPTEELHNKKHSREVARPNSRCSMYASEKLNHSAEAQPRQNSRCSTQASEKQNSRCSSQASEKQNSRCCSQASEKQNHSAEAQPRQKSRCSSHASEKLSHLPDSQPNKEGKADEGKEPETYTPSPPHSNATCGSRTPKEGAESKCSTPSIKMSSQSSSCQEKPNKPLEETLCDIDS
uniref:Protein Flattop n=1 Tax=Geotrypetes seraphini TaxID=260995 RepID=A0A6P8Q224_GEOSA|nr:protein Flattop [Geotrypetes seraphini]